MTILDIIDSKITNTLQKKSLEVIRDNYTGLVNENYTLTLNEDDELAVKIPSLEKRDEYVFHDLSEYEYPLIMCMRLDDGMTSDFYEDSVSHFMNIYGDKLELLTKDIISVNKLMNDIKNVKKHIEYTTYASIVGVILCGLSLCIFNSMVAKPIFLIGVVGFFIISLSVQFTKENRVKSLIDGYISIIKTDWYQSQLRRQYVFLCNFMG